MWYVVDMDAAGPIHKAVEWILDTATDLWQKMHTGAKKQVEPARWCPPRPGWIKCNVDGAFYAEENAGAT
jgi:hypothetical protein